MIVRRSRWKTAALVAWALSGLFFGLLVARLVVLVAVSGGAAPRSALAFILGGAILGAALAVMWGGRQVRRALTPLQPGARPLVTIDAEVAAGPLADPLRSLTVELASLGFVRQRDYGLAGPLGTTSVAGFARLFFHPTQLCFAEVNAVTARATTAQLAVSLLTICDQGWSVAAWSRFNPDTAGLHYVRRLPRALWKIFPNATPDKLLAEHLAMRSPILADLGLSIVSSPLPDIYFDHIQRAAAQRAEAFRHRNIIAYLVEADLYALAPKLEWLGDYPKIKALTARDRFALKT